MKDLNYYMTEIEGEESVKIATYVDLKQGDYFFLGKKYYYIEEILNYAILDSQVLSATMKQMSCLFPVLVLIKQEWPYLEEPKK